jgi:hypothetical protein
MNARRSPGWILSNHTEDQGANLFADTLPSSYPLDSGDPRPIQAKSRSMPVHDGYDVHSRCTLGAPSLMLLYFRLPLEESDGYKDARLAVHSKKTAHTRANTNHKMACGDGFGSPNRGWICPD